MYWISCEQTPEVGEVYTWKLSRDSENPVRFTITKIESVLLLGLQYQVLWTNGIFEKISFETLKKEFVKWKDPWAEQKS